MKFRRVVGKSMLPSLAPGDIVLVSKKRIPEVGDIVVARHDNKEIIKRVSSKTKNKVYLIGDNKKLSTDSRDFGSIPKKDIIGVAVWAIGASRFTLKKPNTKAVAMTFGCLLVFGTMAVILQTNLVFSAKQQIANATSGTKIAKQSEPIHKYALNTISQDVPYCNGQSLDIYYPKKAIYDKAPVVMYFHGGGWEINNKSSEMNQIAVVEGLREEGFAIVSIDYRKLPEFTFPAPVSDALCSVRYLNATSAKTGLDTSKIAIYGFSAGGHLAAMVGTLDSQNTFNEGPYKEQSSRVKAVVTLAGLFDFERDLRTPNIVKLQRLLGDTNWANAAPIGYVTPDDPPFLLVHGLQDQYVAPEQDNLFAQKLSEAGVESKTVHIDNAEHGLGTVSDGPPSMTKEETIKLVHDFIKVKLGLTNQ